MKKFKISSIVMLLASATFLISCSEDVTESIEENSQVQEESSSNNENDNASTVMYQCPDNCNGNRAFFDPGTCKKCAKEMVEI